MRIVPAKKIKKRDRPRPEKDQTAEAVKTLATVTDDGNAKLAYLIHTAIDQIGKRAVDWETIDCKVTQRDKNGRILTIQMTRG